MSALALPTSLPCSSMGVASPHRARKEAPPTAMRVDARTKLLELVPCRCMLSSERLGQIGLRVPRTHKLGRRIWNSQIVDCEGRRLVRCGRFASVEMDLAAWELGEARARHGKIDTFAQWARRDQHLSCVAEWVNPVKAHLTVPTDAIDHPHDDKGRLFVRALLNRPADLDGRPHEYRIGAMHLLLGADEIAGSQHGQ